MDLCRARLPAPMRIFLIPICDDGENFEDVEAGFQDLKEKMSVDLKGSFKDGVFYATEIRMPKIS